MTRITTLFIFLILTACNTSISDESNTPEGMVFIPAGVFEMGGKSAQAEPDELPVRTVSVSAFYADKVEVTNSEFMEFVQATNYKTIAERPIDWDKLKQQLPAATPKPADSVLQPGSLVFRTTTSAVNLLDYSQWWEWKTGANWLHPEGPDSDIQNRMDHPVVHIAYEDAKAYAQWVGKRLLTEAEWEWASMGGEKNAKYPWGNESVEQASDKANFWQGVFPYKNHELDGFFGTAPVKSYPPNGYGLYDMAGNVWELCQDKYHIAAYQLTDTRTLSNPKGPSKSYDPREPYAEKYVTRGGSFLCNDSYCSGYRTARRMSIDRESSLNHTGFRCAKDVE